MLPLVLTLLAGQTHSRWEASAQAQVRVRNATPQDEAGRFSDPNVPPSGVAGDLEVSPRLAGSLFNGPWTLTGAYSPTLRSAEPWVLQRNGRSFGDHSHIVTAEGAWMKEAVARLSIGEYFRYGVLDLSTVNSGATSTGPNPPVTVAPLREGLGNITELTTDTSAAVELFLSRRTTWLTTGGFVYGGGTDERSRAQLPLQSSPRITSKLSWLASLKDTIAGLVGFQYVRFYQVPATATSPAKEGARIAIAELAANYQHLFAEHTVLDATLGVTASFGQIPDATNTLKNVTGVGPLVGAGIAHRETWRGQQLDLRADAKLAPFVDRFAGTVYQRVEGGVGAAWSNSDHFNASLGTGVARSIPFANESALTTIYGDASAGYQGDPWWRVDLSGRVSLLHTDNTIATPATPFFEKQFFIGLSFTAMIGSDQPRTFSQ